MRAITTGSSHFYPYIYLFRPFFIGSRTSVNKFSDYLTNLSLLFLLFMSFSWSLSNLLDSLRFAPPQLLPYPSSNFTYQVEIPPHPSNPVLSQLTTFLFPHLFCSSIENNILWHLYENHLQTPLQLCIIFSLYTFYTITISQSQTVLFFQFLTTGKQQKQ